MMKPTPAKQERLSLGLYIHVPFCRQKCAYCDFYSLPGAEARMDDYVRAVAAQLKEVAPRAALHTVDTVYFGGGTPSYLGIKRLKTLLAAVDKHYALARDAEITLEANPDSAMDWKELRALRRAGFNRISLGMQSAVDEELRAVGRIHTFSQVEAASSGGEARRLLLAGDWDLLLIAAPLPDEFGHDLATDAAEQGLPVLLSVKAELWEEASARVGPAGVVALGRPFSRAVFAQAVGMLRAAQAQVGKLREENKKLRQKLEELRAVSRAKCLLVEYLHLDEESAHKYIERAAMEERKTRRAVAEEIIAEYG